MMTNQNKPVYVGTVKTIWSIRTYDVWGNAREGYEVNDTYSAGEVEIWCPKYRYNAGTPYEFIGASPTDRQIKRALGVTCRIETDGDDTHITVDRRRDSYPLGELYCESHESLSPIRLAR